VPPWLAELLLPLPSTWSTPVLNRFCICAPVQAVGFSSRSKRVGFVYSQCWSVFGFSGGVWIVAEIRPGHTLDLLDQKVQSFLVSIALKRLFPEHNYKVFGEMLVMT
jgi:hypothetical protein